MTKIKTCEHCGTILPHVKQCAVVVRSKLQKGDQDYTRGCFVCGAKPTVFMSESDTEPLCGPCTFGESETAGGDW